MRTPPTHYSASQQHIWVLLSYFICDPNEREWKRYYEELLLESEMEIQQVLLDILCDYGTRYEYHDISHPPYSYWFESGVGSAFLLSQEPRSRQVVIPCLAALISILTLPINVRSCDPTIILDTLDIYGGIGAHPSAIPGIIAILRLNPTEVFVQQEMRRALLKFSEDDLKPYQLALTLIP